MIRIFGMKKETLEEKLIRQAKEIRQTMIELGYRSPSQNTAHCISIWEHDCGSFSVEEMNSKIRVDSQL